jgi:hypothetical protein
MERILYYRAHPCKGTLREARAASFVFSFEKLPSFGKNCNREENRYAVNQKEKVEAGREKRTWEQKLIRLFRVCGEFFLQSMLFFGEF